MTTITDPTQRNSDETYTVRTTNAVHPPTCCYEHSVMNILLIIYSYDIRVHITVSKLSVRASTYMSDVLQSGGSRNSIPKVLCYTFPDAWTEIIGTEFSTKLFVFNLKYRVSVRFVHSLCTETETRSLFRICPLLTTAPMVPYVNNT